MHLNPQHPNILADMQAAANGARLHNPLSKRSLIPRKSYPYASERQNTRINRKMIRLADKIDWDKKRTIDHEPRCDCGHLFEICGAPNQCW